MLGFCLPNESVDCQWNVLAFFGEAYLSPKRRQYTKIYIYIYHIIYIYLVYKWYILPIMLTIYELPLLHKNLKNPLIWLGIPLTKRSCHPGHDEVSLGGRSHS